MIIVFFQVLYLLGKLIYKNYNDNNEGEDNENRASKSKEDNNVVCELPTEKKIQVKPLDYYFGDKNDCIYEVIRFAPPLYIQRYVAVRDILSDKKYEGKIRKVVDFGCAELGFFNHMKNTTGIEEILCVDINKYTLKNNKKKVEPLTCDYLHCRETPLIVRILEGSITDQDKFLENTDAVVCIELIEHLCPPTLLELPFNIFGFIKPKVAIMTTPNAEFNVLFKKNRRFRHYDHKFEWTRKQFEDWSNNIVVRYPDYEVTFHGIGAGPAGTEYLGECSQMAVFHRKREPESFLHGISGLFKIIAYENYPISVHNIPPDEMTIIQEANYHIRRFSQNTEEEEMPLELLASSLVDMDIPVETLRDALENTGLEFIEREGKGLCVVLPEFSSISTDYEDDMSEDNFDDDNREEWPEIHDQDEENWDINTQNSQSAHGDNHAIDFDDISSICSSTHSAISLDESNHELRGSSVDINIDGVDFRHLEALDASKLPSDFDIESFEVSTCLDTTSSSKNISKLVPSFDQINLDLPVSSISLTECIRETSVVSGKPANSYETQYNNSSAILSESTSSILDGKYLHNVSNEITSECQCTRDLKSMCSMYLEPSTCENLQSCPGDITNSDFNCSELLNDSEVFHSDTNLVQNHAETYEFLNSQRQTPQQTSTPHQLDKNTSKKIKHRRANKSEDGKKVQTDRSLNIAGDNEIYSCENVPNNCTSCQRDKMEIMQKLNIHSNIPTPDIESTSSKRSLVHQQSSLPKFSEKSRIPLESPDVSKLSKEENYNGKVFLTSAFTVEHLKEEIFTEAEKIVGISEKSDYIDKDKKNIDRNHEMMRDEASGENYEETEVKEYSPDVRGSPAMSWSPEIMDSGYPNTFSAQDITPDYDLSSITQDRISEPESPSVDDPPKQNFEQVEHTEVGNGDLAKDNRNGQGNNIRAEDKLENLQPLLHTEGAIIQPEQILFRREILGEGDADSFGRDEGFNSSSSEAGKEDIDKNSEAYEANDVSSSLECSKKGEKQ